MEFRHLVAFIAIAEQRHFGRAAKALHLTQPSLSAQLQKLEKSLGPIGVPQLASGDDDSVGQACVLFARVPRPQMIPVRPPIWCRSSRWWGLRRWPARCAR